MDKLLSLNQAAKFLEVHPNTLRRWDQLGILRSIRIGFRGNRKYIISDLEKIIQKGRNQFKGPEIKDQPHIGVGIIIIYNNSVLLKQRTDDYGRGTYSLPGGRVMFGESPEVTAKKETKNKVDININPIPFCVVNTTTYIEEGIHSINLGFYCYIQKIEPKDGWSFFKIDKLPYPMFQPSYEVIHCYLKKKTFSL